MYHQHNCIILIRIRKPAPTLKHNGHISFYAPLHNGPNSITSVHIARLPLAYRLHLDQDWLIVSWRLLDTTSKKICPYDVDHDDKDIRTSIMTHRIDNLIEILDNVVDII